MADERWEVVFVLEHDGNVGKHDDEVDDHDLEEADLGGEEERI